MVKPQFEVGPRARRQGRRRARRRRRAARRSSRWRARRARAGRRGARLRVRRGCPGPKGNRETFVWLAEGGRAGAVADLEAARARRSSRERPARRHRAHPPPPGARPPTALRALIDAAARGGRHAALRRRRDAQARARAARRASSSTRRSSDDVDLCVVARRRRHDPHRAAPLRGHRACRCSRSTSARSASWPRSTPTRLDDGLRPRVRRRLRDARRCRRSRVGRPDGDAGRAINDISVHRKPGVRVADLAYALGGRGDRPRALRRARGRPRPPGSTGYNLANGGPVLAWGVEGFVVSFIAPHSLTARALVVAPERPADDPQPLAGRGRGHARRPPGVRARPGRGDHARRSCARRPTWRSCPGRRSTTGCARSSGGWPR